MDEEEEQDYENPSIDIEMEDKSVMELKANIEDLQLSVMNAIPWKAVERIKYEHAYALRHYAMDGRVGPFKADVYLVLDSLEKVKAGFPQINAKIREIARIAIEAEKQRAIQNPSPENDVKG